MSKGRREVGNNASRSCRLLVEATMTVGSSRQCWCAMWGCLKRRCPHSANQNIACTAVLLNPILDVASAGMRPTISFYTFGFHMSLAPINTKQTSRDRLRPGFGWPKFSAITCSGFQVATY